MPTLDKTMMNMHENMYEGAERRVLQTQNGVDQHFPGLGDVPNGGKPKPSQWF